jgi:hypothetical protein
VESAIPPNVANGASCSTAHMDKIVKNLVLMAAAAGLAGLFFLNPASAAPPSGRQPQVQGRQLDLSAPAHGIENSIKVPAVSSMSRQQTAASPEQERFANLRLGSVATQPPSMEERVRLARRDGLPVARLWESKSALLHLGFNQKGKPGLWIMQKTR